MLPDPDECPDCRLPLAPMCPRCGVDRLALRLRAVVGRALVWDYRDVRVSLRWKKLPPAGRELAAVRRLIPDLADVADAELALALGQAPAWEVGTFPAQEALALFAAARDLHLQPELVYLPETRGTSLDPHAHGDEPDE